jgi:DNA gyrase subunit A
VGIKTLKVTEKTVKVTTARLVNQNQQLMVISKDGMVMSTPVNDMRVLSRSTQGVIIMRMDPSDYVAAVTAWD